MKPQEFTEWRERLGLSRSGAAEALGLSRNMPQRYEDGEADIPLYVELACAHLENSQRIQMESLILEWKQHRDALRAQVSYMATDRAFPDHTYTDEQRDGIRKSLEVMIADYDGLIADWKDWPKFSVGG